MIIYRVYDENGGYTEYAEQPQGVDFEIIDKTPSDEEIAEANKPIVPESISRMYLKIQLIIRGIEIEDVISTINEIPNSMFPEVAKKIAIIKFNEAVYFDRYNADLNLIATLMGLSQEDLDEIFINGNNL
jgi:hypothetical protein